MTDDEITEKHHFGVELGMEHIEDLVSGRTITVERRSFVAKIDLNVDEDSAHWEDHAKRAINSLVKRLCC